MKRLIWLPLAGFLLVAGAAVAAAAPTVLESAKGVIAAASPAASADPSTGTTNPADLDNDGPRLGFRADGLLADVLTNLVTDGTITQAQSDAITAALDQAVTDKQAEMEARRTLIQGFVEDGVITQDEINQLPADDPLRVAWDSIANNGQVTLDQLRGLGPGFGPGGHGHGGPGFWGPPPITTDNNTDSGTDTSTNS